MKRIFITALLVLTAQVANANDYEGKDAVKIMSQGKIVMEREANKYTTNLVVLLKDEAYSCLLFVTPVANASQAICNEIDL